MSDINEKMISEFLELLKKVNSMENQVKDIAKDHSQILMKTTGIAQSMQDSLKESLAKQNILVTKTNDSIAEQVNKALSGLDDRARITSESYLKKNYNAAKFDGIEAHLLSIDDKVESLTKVIGLITKAFRQFEKIEQVTDISLSMDIGDTDFCTRTINCLRTEKINTIEELINRSPKDLKKLYNLGNSSVREIQSFLRKNQLALKKDIEE